MLYMHKILEIKKGVLLAALVLGSHFFTLLVLIDNRLNKIIFEINPHPQKTSKSFFMLYTNVVQIIMKYSNNVFS